MIIVINENIRIWQEFNPIELAMDEISFNFIDFSKNENPCNFDDSKRHTARFGDNKQRIAIRGRWFDALTPSEVVRTQNKSDGYYRVIYIQINLENGEYYIGKANRPTWSQLQRYHRHPSIAEASEKKRLYMKKHPEQFKPMLEASKKLFRSGGTPALRYRNERIVKRLKLQNPRQNEKPALIIGLKKIQKNTKHGRISELKLVPVKKLMISVKHL